MWYSWCDVLCTLLLLGVNIMNTVKLIAMGASTGGFDALEAILTRLHSSVPPVIIAMHLKPGLPRLFASRINELTKLTAKEAETGDVLKHGTVLVAPGGKHAKIVSQAGRLTVQCYEGERVNFVIPSADVLFESVANELNRNAIGVILTGIGADGAEGLLKMRQKGAVTIGQDMDTCTVYGMPKVAKEMGAVEHELPVNRIADKILSLL